MCIRDRLGYQGVPFFLACTFQGRVNPVQVVLKEFLGRLLPSFSEGNPNNTTVVFIVPPFHKPLVHHPVHEASHDGGMNPRFRGNLAHGHGPRLQESDQEHRLWRTQVLHIDSFDARLDGLSGYAEQEHRNLNSVLVEVHASPAEDYPWQHTIIVLIQYVTRLGESTTSD